jgi:hypothetical protein
MGIAWDYTNPEEDVEVAIVGPEEMQFVLTLWHGIEGQRPSLEVHRDHADIKHNLVSDLTFDSAIEAKTWAEQRLGER